MTSHKGSPFQREEPMPNGATMHKEEKRRKREKAKRRSSREEGEWKERVKEERKVRALVRGGVVAFPYRGGGESLRAASDRSLKATTPPPLEDE